MNSEMNRRKFLETGGLAGLGLLFGCKPKKEGEDKKIEVKRAEFDDETWNSVLEELDYPKILKDTAYEFGIDPYRRIGYQRELQYNEDILQNTAKLNKKVELLNQKGVKAYPLITPGVLTACALQEGLARYDKYKSEKLIDTYMYLGIDCFPDEINRLASKGLLDANDFVNMKVIDISEAKHKNEKGTSVKSIGLLPVKNALEGLGAIMIDKVEYVINEIGVEAWNKLSKEEQYWCFYAAMNWGQGNLATLLKDEVVPLRDDRGRITRKKPISEYIRYKDGQPLGSVNNIHEYIYRNHGRSYRAEKNYISFHHNACQVVVFAIVADKFFEIYPKYRP